MQGLAIGETGENIYFNVTNEADCKALFSDINAEDKIIICGGDGTLNRFINSINGLYLKNDILYFAAGSGNDFLNDLGKVPDKNPIKINDYIRDLPVLTVEGKDYRFINGIGFGLDGYACAQCNRVRQEKGKNSSYVAAAVKGLIGAYSPVNAKVIVDGEVWQYKKVWMASCMKGRYFGGGLKIAPDQQRSDINGEITSIIVHNLSRFRILTVFPSIFKGTHVKYTKFVAVKKGKEVTVEFDRPVALQLDGETIPEVRSYTVKANKNLVVEI